MKYLKCPYCKKKFPKEYRNQKYCTKDCQRKDHREKNKDKLRKERVEYYHNNKEQYAESAKRWELNNPRKFKQTKKKAMDKYLKNNKEKFNKLQNGYYHKNKDKQISRSATNKILKGKYGYGGEKHKLKKVCYVCDSRYKVWLFYDIYPLTPENIIKAIKLNRIKYLCRRHWKEASRVRKLKYLRNKYKIKNKELIKPCSVEKCKSKKGEFKVKEKYKKYKKHYCNKCFNKLIDNYKIYLRV